MSDELPELALTLARGLGAGRPKSVELRQAVLSAYYAVFHALRFMCADQLVGRNRQWQFFTALYRAIGHRVARTVLNNTRRADPGSTIAAIAITFSQLQDVRHEADDNLEPFRLNRTATTDLIEAGRRAVSLLNTLASDDKLMLAVRLVARTR